MENPTISFDSSRNFKFKHINLLERLDKFVKKNFMLVSTHWKNRTAFCEIGDVSSLCQNIFC